MANLIHPDANYPNRSYGHSGTVKMHAGVLSIGAADLTVNTLHRLWIAPKGAILLALHLRLTDLDTHATPTLSITLGDAGDDDRLIAASNIGQAGGIVSAIATAGVFYTFPADTAVNLKIATAAATGAAGTASFLFQYGLTVS